MMRSKSSQRHSTHQTGTLIKTVLCLEETMGLMMMLTMIMEVVAHLDNFSVSFDFGLLAVLANN